MNRRQTRYWLFRLKTEAEGGAPATGCPSELKGRYKVDPFVDALGGFTKFAIAWDIKDDLTVYPRKFSIWQEWQSEIESAAKPLRLEPTGKPN